MAINDDMIKWSLTLSLRGALSGQVSFTNQDDTYDELLWTPLRLKIGCTAVASDGIDLDCLTGTEEWFEGLIQGNDDLRQIPGEFCSLKLVSYFQHLQNKPVNTVKYDTDALIVLTDLLDVFAALPSALFDLSGMTETKNIFAIVKGDNIIEEARKVAEANQAELFVQKGGVLTAEDWKDHTDPVDTVIPKETIVEAVKQRSFTTSPTRIIVRGRFVSQLECGEQRLGNSDPLDVQPIDPEGESPDKVFCSIAGVKTGSVDVKMKGLRGSKTDIKNSRIETTEPEVATVTEVRDTKDGEARITIDLSESATESEVGIKVTGKKQYKRDFDDPNSKQQPLRGKVQESTRYGSGTSGNLVKLEFPGPPKEDNTDKTPQESEPIQLQLAVTDEGLKDEFGVITDEITNLYSSTYEDMFDIAVRKFQEFRMARNTWQVRCSYLPCLELNDVVQFITPGPQPKTITGLLAGINLEYDVSPSARMTLTVWGFDELDNVEYTSSNLLAYPDLCGTNGVDWIEETTGDGHVTMYGGYSVLGGGLTGSATLKQPIIAEVGATYTISGQVLFGDSPTILDIIVRDSSGIQASTTADEDGFFSLTFTPDEEVNDIEFSVGPEEGVLLHSLSLNKSSIS